MNKTNIRAAEILLVEDTPGDARLAEEALKEGGIVHNLHHVEDGVEAMAFLRRERQYSDKPKPDLMLLDLNLPKKDGQEVLSEVKSDEELKTIPVVILSTSQSDDDIQKTYLLHANCFISKPVDMDRFIEVIKGIEKFWLSDVTLPSKLR